MLSCHGQVAKAESAAKTVLSTHDAKFQLAPQPYKAPADASPGELLVLGLRNRSSSGTSGGSVETEIKRIRLLSTTAMKEAEKFLDQAQAGVDYFRKAVDFIAGGIRSLPQAPPGIPEFVSQHIFLLNRYADAGLVDRREVGNALHEAASRGGRIVEEARHEFKRFRFTLAIAHCHQAAIYARLWQRDAMADGYDKRADKMSKAYRAWAVARRGPVSARAMGRIN